jgi:hypothetical protein
MIFRFDNDLAHTQKGRERGPNNKKTNTMSNKSDNTAAPSVDVPHLVRDFPWGPIERVHEIGEYQIVEYHPQVFKNCCGTGEYHEYTHYHSYRDGKDCRTSYETLDEALIGVIACKYDGANSQAAAYFGRMIGIANATDLARRVPDSE